MRIVWMSPWFRTLATAWATGLRDLGHEVLVVTTGQHFDGPALAADDLSLDHRWRTLAGAHEGREVIGAVRRFEPDVVVAEQLRDPRLLAAIPRGVRAMVMVHDAVPHDDAHRPPLVRRAVSRLQGYRSRDVVVFSEHVASAIRSGGTRRRRVVHVVPLTSEMPDGVVPELVPAAGRRDFLVVGRLNPYKNLPVVLRAWDIHRAGPGFRDDRLVLVGDGDPGVSVPAHVEWVRGRFRFEDLAPRLAAAKGSLAFYTAGSQSGVALTSMQCGTGVLVSNVGGLPEYLPAGENGLHPSDVQGLARMMDRFADPENAESAGRVARREYESRFGLAATSSHWDAILRSDVLSGDPQM